MRWQLAFCVLTILLVFGFGVTSGYKRDWMAVSWFGALTWSFLFGYATGALALVARLLTRGG